jgi:DICT domain-containing protein
VSAIRDVLRERRSGSTLESALERAKRKVDAPRSSVLATVRASLGDIAPNVLTKRTMLAISRSIEDESIARAHRPVLVGAFQREVFWRASQSRWTDIASTASVALVLASSKRPRHRGAVWEIALEPAAPLLREWVVAVDSPSFSACLVGVERPGNDGRADADRLFEALWTVEPAAAREATRVAAALAVIAYPELRRPLQQLREPAMATYDTIRAATSVTNRIVGYMDRWR